MNVTWSLPYSVRHDHRVVESASGSFRRISTGLLLVFMSVFHARELLSALGSFAVAAQVLFIFGMALVAYTFGFGLNQAKCIAMADPCS